MSESKRCQITSVQNTETTTYTRHLVTCSYLAKSVTKGARVSRAKICARYAQAGEMQKPLVLTPKKKLNEVYGKKYRINLDHQILTDHGIFYPQSLYNDLVFEVTLAPASQVVKGSDPTKLKYKLTNIQLEYEMIHSEMLAEEAMSV